MGLEGQTLVILADARQVDELLNLGLLQYVLRADARALQNSRGAECAGTQKNKTLRADGVQFVVCIWKKLMIP